MNEYTTDALPLSDHGILNESDLDDLIFCNEGWLTSDR